MKPEKILQKSTKNLPKEYVEAVQRMNLAARINTLGSQHGLSDEEIDTLDQEIVYLLLDLTGPADFTERLSNNLSVDNEKLLKIIKHVTTDIIKPLQQNVRKQGGNPGKIPVPPPPESSDGGPPTPSYGGTSDPYREPTDK